MIRPVAAIVMTLASLSAPLAQEAAPAAAPAPVIEIDPSATIDSSPKQLNLLTGLYATQAIIEICAVTVPADVVTRMDRQRLAYEGALGMDASTGTRAYESTKAEVQKTSPDCAEGSPDRQGVDAVLAIYLNN